MINTTSQISLSSPPQNSAKSYVAATISKPPPFSFPKKEQAIVLHAIPDTPLIEFVKQIGNIVSPKNITFASRISNQRICIYLSSTSIVDSLMKSHPNITINSNIVPIRRLVSPSKRILISNVSPTIPHSVIENALRDLGLQPVAPVSFVKCGALNEDYAHIMSFRRVTYIIPNTEDFSIQTSVLIKHEETQYRIFISTDKLECFLCKQTGHSADSCQNIPTTQSPIETQINAETLSQSMFNPSNASSLTLPSSYPSTSPSYSSTAVQPEENLPAPLPPHQGLKRGISTDSLTSQVTTSSTPDPTTFRPPPPSPNISKHSKPQKKKNKIVTSEDHKLSPPSLDAIQSLYIHKHSELTLTKSQFIAFLENSFGNSDPLNEALTFTTNIVGLLNDIALLHSDTNVRALKNRLTRLQKKLIDS